MWVMGLWGLEVGDVMGVACEAEGPKRCPWVRAVPGWDGRGRVEEWKVGKYGGAHRGGQVGPIGGLSIIGC